MNNHLFIFAGEQSGDLIGGLLMRAMKQQDPTLSFFGVGGPSMRNCGMDCIMQMEDFQIMGFSAVIKALPKLIKQFKSICRYIIDKQPAAVILIDYPGFNLRLAKALRKRGFKNKIIQYVSPSVWAHGKQRIEQMEATLDLLLTIYPFEKQYFSHTSLSVQYVGNPILEAIENYRYNDKWQKEIGIANPKYSSRPLIAIFPGSRQHEINRNFPKQLAAAEKLQKSKKNIRFGISVVREDVLPYINKAIQNSSLKLDVDLFLIPKKYTYELMRDSHLACAKSGTIALELALHKVPSVMVYGMSLLNRLFARFILNLNLPHYSMVNILGNKRIFPELIETGFSAENMYNEMKLLAEDGDLRDRCISECRAIHDILQPFPKGAVASKLAAQAIGKVLAC